MPKRAMRFRGDEFDEGVSSLRWILGTIAILTLTCCALCGCMEHKQREVEIIVRDQEAGQPVEQPVYSAGLASEVKRAVGGNRQLAKDFTDLCGSMAELVQSNDIDNTRVVVHTLIRARKLLHQSGNDAIGDLFEREFKFLKPPHEIKPAERSRISGKFIELQRAFAASAK
jgi:hypothetical protein